ncbi:hypothetical protein JCM33374_g1965 [Metschnikowia sp. JCM 33374]|nr:hypothetical protein JCM33374_g1965 [Metschnikowia sp. JCM 33374]
MANAILAARATNPPLTIGNNWLSGYLNRTTGLTSKIARPRDYIRVYFETPEKFNDWFNRVENTIMEFGIEKHDVYNVDETGFAMGILSATKVITGSDSREDPVIIQPGNREWVTAIECISAAGFALPPFIIMKGARLQKGWFNNIPPKWQLGVTENGWTNN